jgi:hypothetical protein
MCPFRMSLFRMIHECTFLTFMQFLFSQIYSLSLSSIILNYIESLDKFVIVLNGVHSNLFRVRS